MRPLYLAISVIGYPIGWLVSHLILGFIYFGVITPIGLALRVSGRDPLARKADATTSTHWKDRAGARGADGYFRQF